MEFLALSFVAHTLEPASNILIPYQMGLKFGNPRVVALSKTTPGSWTHRLMPFTYGAVSYPNTPTAF
jgi:hypothetical protein